jgi:hypothetical protein
MRPWLAALVSAACATLVMRPWLAALASATCVTPCDVTSTILLPSKDSLILLHSSADQAAPAPPVPQTMFPLPRRPLQEIAFDCGGPRPLTELSF